MSDRVSYQITSRRKAGLRGDQGTNGDYGAQGPQGTNTQGYPGVVGEPGPTCACYLAYDLEDVSATGASQDDYLNYEQFNQKFILAHQQANVIPLEQIDFSNIPIYPDFIEARTTIGIGKLYTIDHTIVRLTRPQSAFTSQWRTTTPSESITLPIDSGGTYNFQIDWGDGSPIDTIVSGTQPQKTHTYTDSGDYTVQIRGQCWGWRFADTGDKNKIILISKWGEFDLLRLHGIGGGSYFNGCSNLDIIATDEPSCIGITNMDTAFRNCSNLIGVTGNWDWTSMAPNATFNNTFTMCPKFNGTITSTFANKPTQCFGMFSFCNVYNNHESNSIADWDMSDCIQTGQMFAFSTSFNQPLEWGSSFKPLFLVGDYPMFYNASSFNGSGLSDWDTSLVTNMNSLFFGCINFNQSLGSNFLTSSVTDCAGMFNGASNFNNGGSTSIQDWDMTNVSSCGGMFSGCSAFSHDLSSWNITDKVTALDAMFQSTQVNFSINSWDLSNVVGLGSTFRSCSQFNHGGTGLNWDLGSCTSIRSTFENCPNFNQTVAFGPTFRPTLQYNEDSAGGVFSNCTSFNSAGVETWDLSGLTDFRGFFKNCSNYNYPLPSGFISSTVTNARSCFMNCNQFDQDINSWDFSECTDLADIFSGASIFNNGGTGITQDCSSATNMNQMFYFCTNLNVPLNLVLNINLPVTLSSFMTSASSFNQDLSNFDISQVTAFNNAFLGTAINHTNWSLIFTAWGVASTQTGLNFSVSGIDYNLLSPSGQNGIYYLKYTKLWNITGIANLP